jgi:hypothetical protein
MSRPIAISLFLLISILSLGWWWGRLVDSGNAAMVVLFILWQGAFYFNGYIWASGLSWLARKRDLPSPGAYRAFPNLHPPTLTRR